ncbi:MAG: glutamine-synthetase adenylyltransferase [Bdellovibrionales bacterium]
MKIRAISSYTSAELERAGQMSPAILRYLNLSQEADPLLRRRHQAWVESALATLLKSASAEAVTRHWSDAADEILIQVWHECGLGKDEVALFALGKLGAQELNLSSDVDLVVVAAANTLDSAAPKLRQFQRRLSHHQADGWLLRVDFDLRPGGRFGPVITTPGQLRDYYWNQGETWERLAWVRARHLVGSGAIADEVFESLTPFCYRKFLDFTVMEDLKLLRRRIHSANATPSEQLHLKLGQGGIRDLELFVHSLLIIHAGRRPELRTHSTPLAIQNLQEAKLLPTKDAQFLLRAYWQLRQWENALQAVDDRQTHILDLLHPAPLSEDEKNSCFELCQQVDQLVSTLLGSVQTDANAWPDGDDAQVNWLNERGVSTATAREVWPALLSTVALSGKTERDELARRQFLGQFIEALHDQSLDADLGLKTLLDFVRSVRAKATLFSLLLREPRLIRDLAHLFSVSPYLGQMISARPELLDAFLSQKTRPASGPWDTFLEDLVERRQLSELLAAGQFLNSRDTIRFGQDLSETADYICQEILSRLEQEFQSTTMTLIHMGKWGGRELGVRSDLDFVLLTEKKPNENDQRVARRLITRLTENHRGGRLYAIDMRLRPTGHAGPLLLQKEHLLSYLSTRAAAWERQSYLRARVQDTELSLSLRQALFARAFTLEEKKELRSIRERLRTAPSEQCLDLKAQVGGLVEIEFTAQIAILLNALAQAPADTFGAIGFLAQNLEPWHKHGPALQKIYLQLRLYEQLQQLTGFHSGSKLDVQSDEFLRLSRLMKLNPEEFVETVRMQLAAAALLLEKLDPLHDAV